MSAPDWDAFVREFVESQFGANPQFAADAGRHEFDGRLPDWSPAGLSREAARLRAARRRALAFDAGSLDLNRRFERDYLISRIDSDLFWLESAQWPTRNPRYYSGALDPNLYVTREYAPAPQRMRAYVNYARAVPVAVAQIRGNLRTPLVRAYVDIGKTAFGGLAAYYEKDVPAAFAAVGNAALQSEFREANALAVKAMKELEAWLQQQRAGATDAFALGPDLFLKMLRDSEDVEVSLAQLENAGRRDLELNLGALRDICRDFAPGKSITDCVARAQASKPPGGAVEGARGQLAELKAFIVAKDLVTIPGSEEARVAEAPPYMRWNFAFINIPGPYEKGLPSTYYVSPPDPAWSKEERDAYVPGRANLLFTSAHEVWPGHFLQFLHSNRSASRFGQVFGSYAFMEGWAHYAEEMIWEAGLGNGDPETRVGQLLNALLRDVRFLSAIGLHTRGMTLDESQRMFRDLAYQDAATARQQAARGAFDPAYLNYTLGKLMIRKLREEWTASRGGRKAWREFHDRFLSYGRPPIPLVRKVMLGAAAADTPF